MAEGSPDSIVVKTIGPMIGGAIGGLLTWLTTGLPGWLSSTIASLQSVGGAILGLLAQFLLAYAVLVYVMPWLGLNLLDMARGLAALDLPVRLFRQLGMAL